MYPGTRLRNCLHQTHSLSPQLAFLLNPSIVAVVGTSQRYTSSSARRTVLHRGGPGIPLASRTVARILGQAWLLRSRDAGVCPVPPASWLQTSCSDAFCAGTGSPNHSCSAAAHSRDNLPPRRAQRFRGPDRRDHSGLCYYVASAVGDLDTSRPRAFDGRSYSCVGVPTTLLVRDHLYAG